MRPTIGTLPCPECGATAEVKEDKNGHAYRFCPECTAQYFTRGGDREAALRAKLKPAAVPAQAPAATPAPNDRSDEPTAKKKPGGSLWENLYGAKA